METIKVNMSPNPLDVQTIHASQNDGEARQWEFELHNNGELIDTSEITEQLFFKAYKGGTEQILPENTSTPTTSPFNGDIRYPQGLLTDQEFTYRQSPTEEDGLAKITDIKGNTLVWNQLVSLIISSTTTGGITYTVSGGEFTINGTATQTLITKLMNDYQFQSGHKYLFKGIPSSASGSTHRLDLRQTSDGGVIRADIKNNTVIAIGTSVSGYITLRVQSDTVLSNVKYAPQIFDLTTLGIDNLTDNEVVKWFADYFPLSYYAYNQGSLLSFNGNVIKTVGFNLCDNEWEKKSVNSSGTKVANNSAICNVSLINVSLHGSYYFHIDNVPFAPNGRYIHKFGANLEYLGYSGINNDSVVTIPDDTFYIYIQINRSGNITEDITQTRVNFNISDSSKNGTYEPYNSSTLSLPISTYFPTGMKSAGNVYDELTESKAITRVGQITINGSYNVYLTELTNCVRISLDHGRTDVKYPNPVQASNYLPFLVNFSQDSEHFYMNGASAIIFILKSKCGTTAESVKAYLNSNPLTVHYELATPTETSFTTASLVTENAEIPLSNEDGTLIGKCTEQLSENPGFFDAKIKLADSDGECYSNKIQLHIERSPQ